MCLNRQKRERCDKVKVIELQDVYELSYHLSFEDRRNSEFLNFVRFRNLAAGCLAEKKFDMCRSKSLQAGFATS